MISYRVAGPPGLDRVGGGGPGKWDCGVKPTSLLQLPSISFKITILCIRTNIYYYACTNVIGGMQQFNWLGFMHRRHGYSPKGQNA